VSARADAVLEPRLFADFATPPGTGAEPDPRPADGRADGPGDGSTGATDGVGAEPDAVLAERAWLAGDPVTALAAADRALAAGDDPLGRAATVVAAAAGADGALSEAATRWRGVAAIGGGAAAVQAHARAALACALVGRVATAEADLAAARAGLADPAPRGLTVLLDGVSAVLDAVRGDLRGASDRLAGLAAATVPSDAFAVDSWPELVIEVLAAGGEEEVARAVLAAHPSEPSGRRLLLAAWLDLRAGRLADARVGLAAAAKRPALRRNAVLAAAVTVGLARRSGDAAALATTWHRVAPVVAGAEVELLQVDVWGELSTGAAAVPAAGPAAAAIAASIDAAVAAAGGPTWCAAAALWWRVQRAVVAADPAAAAAAAAELSALAGGSGRVQAVAAAAGCWADVLAGRVEVGAVRTAAQRLVGTGRPWEAAALCLAAAARTDEPATARELLGAGRTLRGRVSPDRAVGRDGLSRREREVGRLVLDGLTQREIGARLYISPKTVEQHVARLRQKLVAANRAELVAALRTRLQPPATRREG
jgi:DNA-binding CsgD family transcriptional regulator